MERQILSLDNEYIQNSQRLEQLKFVLVTKYLLDMSNAWKLPAPANIVTMLIPELGLVSGWKCTLHVR